MRSIRTALFALGTIALLAAPQAAPPDRKAPGVRKNSDPFLSGAPFTFEQVLRLLGQDAIPLRRRKEAIQNRGLAFSPSPAEIDKLKSLGASDEMLKLIKSKATPVVASLPPKPPPVGRISITCAPAECEISLNGTSLGPTQGGILELAELAPGHWTIDLKKDGYVGSQSVVAVEAERTTPLSAVLTPNRATQEALGAELFRKVVLALGGSDALKELASAQAAGSATIPTHDGKSVRWTLFMRNRPDRALFQAQAGKILYEVAFKGSEYKTSKNLKGQDALDLPGALGFIRDNQLSALISKLGDPRVKLLASHRYPLPSEEFALTAESGSEKISISLDNDLRPQRLQIAGSVLITWSDYVQTGQAYYPSTSQIKPDGWPQGIDVHFDTVAPSPKLNDGDYKLKGKPLTH
jgi:PEGA domain